MLGCSDTVKTVLDAADADGDSVINEEEFRTVATLIYTAHLLSQTEETTITWVFSPKNVKVFLLFLLLLLLLFCDCCICHLLKSNSNLPTLVNFVTPSILDEHRESEVL